jgi:hypothetical protein
LTDAELRSRRVNTSRGDAARSRVSLRTWVDLFLDTALLLAFGVAFTFRFTGLTIHEWFGLAFGLALLIHLTLHWDWVVRTTRGMLSTAGRRRLMWVINFILMLDLTLCIASGILISEVAIPSLGIHLAGVGGYWTTLHSRTADAAIVLIAVHIGLDWRWIVTVVRRTTRGLIGTVGRGRP